MGVGDGRVQCFDLLHLVAAGIIAPPPLPLTGSCKHVTIHPRGMTLLGVERPCTNVHSNFKIKFQTYIFEIIFKDNFPGLMFVYTTSDVFLTLRFKF